MTGISEDTYPGRPTGYQECPRTTGRVRQAAGGPAVRGLQPGGVAPAPERRGAGVRDGGESLK